MASLYKYIRGDVGQTNWATPATESHPWPISLKHGVWKNVDLKDPRTTCNAYHSDQHVLGRNGDNLRIHLNESGGLTYECETRDDAIANDVRFEILTRKITSSSLQYEIGESHFETFDGVNFLIVDSIKRLIHVGPVTHGLCSLAGVSIEKDRYVPSRLVAQMAAVTNFAGGKRPKKLMNVGSMPAGMLNGIALMNAADAGKGCTVRGIHLSAESVQCLIRNRQHAIL